MRDLLFTKAAPAAFANTSSFCPRIPRRVSPPARSGISRHIFSAQRCSTWSKNQERKEGCSTWNIKEERVAEGVNVPRGTMSGKKEKNQLKCKAKKKKPDQKRQKKYRPKRRYFYPKSAVARTTPKMKRIKIAVFRAATRVAWRDGSRITRAARITPRRRLSSRTCPRSVRTGYPATCCRERGKSCRPACRRSRVCRCRGRRPTR